MTDKQPAVKTKINRASEKRLLSAIFSRKRPIYQITEVWLYWVSEGSGTNSGDSIYFDMIGNSRWHKNPTYFKVKELLTQNWVWRFAVHNTFLG